jgi:hypothetical protein
MDRIEKSIEVAHRRQLCGDLALRVRKTDTVYFIDPAAVILQCRYYITRQGKISLRAFDARVTQAGTRLALSQYWLVQ